MKKFLSLLAALIFTGSFQSYAEKSKVYIEIYQSGHIDRGTVVKRSPMRIPIDVYYDDELRQIEFSSVEDLDVQVYLYDENGNTITYSPTINTTLNVSDGYSGMVSIRIDGKGWIATGMIVV